MKKVLTVKKKLSGAKVLAADSSNRTFQVSTDRQLSVGQSILVVNGIVVATVTKSVGESYEV